MRRDTRFKLLAVFAFASTILAAPSSLVSEDQPKGPLADLASIPSPLDSSLPAASSTPATYTDDESPSPTSIQPEYATVSPASDASNLPLWNQDTAMNVQPIRGKAGATIMTPDDEALDRQNPDLLAPPTTDHGNLCVIPTISSTNTHVNLNSTKVRMPSGLWPLVIIVFRMEAGHDKKMASIPKLTLGHSVV